jgi:hypothetical protein
LHGRRPRLPDGPGLEILCAQTGELLFDSVN